ncbi:MAG: NYN domain-containing protein [Desulforudis sp.]|jgi:predicted RNA-binding protein with PIN domain|nr:MAG: NYN domain-containing protein [Desulforudis sp.]
MKECLLIDGYNVIFNIPEFDTLDLAHARGRLADILANYAGLTDHRVILVFDAHRVAGGVGGKEWVNQVEVIYTAEGETADNVIERLVGKLVGNCTVHVVTADWTEQRMIWGQGAYRMHPREFWARVSALRQDNKTYRKDRPADEYLENRLGAGTRKALEAWRNKKLCE